MVDDNQDNDEYKFEDLETYEPESFEGEEGTPPVKPDGEEGGLLKNPVIRNSLIVVGIVVVLMLGYKYIGPLFITKEPTVKPAVQSLPTVKPAPVVKKLPETPAQPVTRQPTVPPTLRQKLSALEESQQTIRTDMTNLHNQLSAISSNIDNLPQQLQSLSQAVTDLAQKVDQQSNQIALLNARTKPKRPVVHKAHRKPKPRPIVFYIQAVIPGRAWLISTKGTTITVREGSIVPGYGVIKMIDARQGRVLTSSGRTIKFSQQDS